MKEERVQEGIDIANDDAWERLLLVWRVRQIVRYATTSSGDRSWPDRTSISLQMAEA